MSKAIESKLASRLQSYPLLVTKGALAQRAQRFAVFSQLSHPAPLPFSRYLDVCETKLEQLTLEQLAAATANCFKSAKGAIDKALQGCDGPPSAAQRAELVCLAKVAIGNRAFLAAETEPMPQRGAKRAVFDFSAHACYPLVRLKPVASSKATQAAS